MTIVACLLLVGCAGLLLVAGMRQHVSRGTPRVRMAWLPPDDTLAEREGWDEGDGPGGVREPRRPLPSGGAASAALPEPDDRAA